MATQTSKTNKPAGPPEKEEEVFTAEQEKMLEQLMKDLNTLDPKTIATLTPKLPIKPALRDVLRYYLAHPPIVDEPAAREANPDGTQSEQPVASPFDPLAKDEHFQALCALVPGDFHELRVRAILLQLADVPSLRSADSEDSSFLTLARYSGLDVPPSVSVCEFVYRMVDEALEFFQTYHPVSKAQQLRSVKPGQQPLWFKRLRVALASCLDPNTERPCSVIGPFDVLDDTDDDLDDTHNALIISTIDMVMDKLRLEGYGFRVKWITSNIIDPGGNNLRGGWVVADARNRHWELVRGIFFADSRDLGHRSEDPGEHPQPDAGVTSGPHTITIQQWLTLCGFETGHLAEAETSAVNDTHRITYLISSSDNLGSRVSLRAPLPSPNSSVSEDSVPLLTLYFPSTQDTDTDSHRAIWDHFADEYRTAAQGGYTLTLDTSHHQPLARTLERMWLREQATKAQRQLVSAMKTWDAVRDAARQYRNYRTSCLAAMLPLNPSIAGPLAASARTHLGLARKGVLDAKAVINLIKKHLPQIKWEETNGATGEKWQAALVVMEVRCEELYMAILRFTPGTPWDRKLLQELKARREERKADSKRKAEDEEPVEELRRSKRVRRPSRRLSEDLTA